MDEPTLLLVEEKEGLLKEKMLLSHIPQMTEVICSQFEDIITLIKGNCQLILHDSFDQESVKQYLMEVMRLIDRLTLLIKQLHALCRLSENCLKNF